jgi:glycosyltransferase involved in cell wall biosynthesis
MNIAFVNPEYPSPSGSDQGGIATYTYSMANACAREGCCVYVLVKKGTVPKQLDKNVLVMEFCHESLPGLGRWINRFIKSDTIWEQGFSWGLRKKLLEIHNERPLDIVEVPEYNGLACELSTPIPFPVIIHFHTPAVLVDFYNAQKNTRQLIRWHAFEAKSLANATAFRCPSIALKMDMCERYAIKQNLISLIRHPFDTSPFDCVTKLSGQSDYIDILFVGRLERRKGAEIIRSEINRILALDRRIRMTFAGESTIGDMGNYRNAIEYRLSEDDRERVFFLGPNKRDKLSVLYCRSDIFCLPSLYENAPFSLLEAMAAKLPIVGSRAGGIPELIRHGENGLLFDPENPIELVNCIQRLITDRDHAAEFGRKAYETVVDACNPKKITQESIRFFETVLSDFHS